MKKTVFTFFALLVIFFGICCKQSKNTLPHGNQISNIFFGDSELAKKYYFKTLVAGNEVFLLKKQNEKYQKVYFNFKDYSYSLSKDITIKLIKEVLPNKKNVKINLYTYRGKDKIDSVQFYRNISGEGFGKYNCLSYFDKKTNKIWQIQYFPSNPLRDDSSGIISYSENNITFDGRIKSDSLHYLDESLDAEMEKYNLYY